MSRRTYKIIFMGTPDFAVPGLKALQEDERFEIVGVITQEDKPVGRKQELLPTPVKKAALDLGLKVIQPRRLREVTEELKGMTPDFIVVIAYGQILPEKVLNTPTVACVNVHASLLPKYRGAACLQAPILNGDSETGVTIMLMDKGLDTGDILKQEKIGLNGNETLETIHDQLSQLGASILGNTLIEFAEGKIQPQKQDENLASYVKVIDKKDGQINWNEEAEAIERKIRAFNPWPGSFGYLDGKMVKVGKAEVSESGDNMGIGQVFEENNQLLVRCGQKSLLILELQLEGKKSMDAKSFLAGHKDIVGKKFE